MKANEKKLALLKRSPKWVESLRIASKPLRKMLLDEKWKQWKEIEDFDDKTE